MKILVIRRDNIGDLVCTTPLLRALRARFPGAWIGALVNSYNAPVLAGNPDVDEVFIYRKAKHRGEGESLLGSYGARAALLWRLRRTGIDHVILAAPARQPSAERFARWIAPRRVLGGQDSAFAHEAEKVFSALAAYGIDGPPPACRVVADPAAQARLRAPLPANWAGLPLIAIHISARKPSQRWPAQRYAELVAQLHARHGAAFLLFWSPGAADNPLHPGDDDKAAQIAALCRGLPLLPVPTGELEELIAGLALADAVICSDGGAMHLAAGLGKPIVCMFGDSDASRWHPWGVPHELLQPANREVRQLAVADLVAAYERLQARLAGVREPAPVAEADALG
jgi:ADP-heptose:LPS heptosyltransferase